MKKYALISVADKTGVADFAKKLTAAGYEILSTGGTSAALEKAGIAVTSIDSYTGFPEILNGRVKTLHPKVHGGILAIRNNKDHVAQMNENEIGDIGVVVVNLYPFESTIAKEGCKLEDAIENIDIGGVALLRAAAKNYSDVAVIVDAADYETVADEISGGSVSDETRLRLARKAFAHTANYDSAISGYFSRTVAGEVMPDELSISLKKIQSLRYGENSHQLAAFYRPGSVVEAIGDIEQLHGKELSFNNIIDLNAAYEITRFINNYFDKKCAVIIKHTNPCGAALGSSLKDALVRARSTDPDSAYGSIIGLNSTVDAAAAEEVANYYVECVIAPSYDDEAIEILTKKKNIRVITSSDILSPVKDYKFPYDIKTVKGGVLLQQWDIDEYTDLKVITDKKPDNATLAELKFAWLICKFVKSNAIVYTKDYMTIGIGAGQMSRVDSSSIAVMKAGNAGLALSGSVMASDAFFPFRDAVDVAAKAGIKAIIQPGGSIHDEEVIVAANEHGIPMIFTGMRHFRH